MVQATGIFGGDSVQYDTLHKRLGEFIDAYPSLPTFESSETGMKKFIGDWVSMICHKKTLWGVDNKEYQITEHQRTSLIEDFRSQFGQCPLLIHAVIYKYTLESDNSKNARIDLRLKETELRNFEVMIQEKNDLLTKKEEVLSSMFSELFSKINVRSKGHLVEDYGEDVIGKYIITSQKIASQESTSRCSITSKRTNIFQTNTANTFAIEHIGPSSDLILAWDQGDKSQDSCRAIVNDNYTIIALCDGVSEEESSGIYSSLITEALTHEFAYTRKNGILFSSPIINQHILSQISSENQHPMFNEFYSRTITEQILKLRSGKSTLVQLIIHPSGLVQYHRIGDTCIWRIRADSTLELISPLNKEVIRTSDTEYIGERMPPPKNLSEAFVKLEPNDAIFACTDQVSEWIIDNNELEILGWYQRFKDEKNLTEITAQFFSHVSQQHGGNDHQTFALYIHTSKESPSTSDTKEIMKDKSGILHWKGQEYRQKGDKPYYYNSEHCKGVKTLPSESIYSNLKFISKEYELPWLLDYNVEIGSNDGEKTYLIEMQHLTEQNGFIELGDINWNNPKDDSTRKFLPLMERLLSQLREEIDQSGVTHRDIALSNLFYDTSLDKLVLVDHNSVYTHGAFTGYSGRENSYQEEQGHLGMYGPEDLDYTANIFHEYSHRFPLKLLEFTFRIIDNVNDHDCHESLVTDNSSGELIFSKEEVDLLFKPNSDKSEMLQRIVDLTALDIDSLTSMASMLSFPHVFFED